MSRALPFFQAVNAVLSYRTLIDLRTRLPLRARSRAPSWEGPPPARLTPGRLSATFRLAGSPTGACLLALGLLAGCQPASSSPTGLFLRFSPDRNLELPVASYWMTDGSAQGEVTPCAPDTTRSDGAWACSFTSEPTGQPHTLQLILGDMGSSCWDVDGDCAWPVQYTNSDTLDGQGGTTVLEPIPETERQLPETLQLEWDTGIPLTSAQVVLYDKPSGIVFTGTAIYDDGLGRASLVPSEGCAVWDTQTGCALPSGLPLNLRIFPEQASSFFDVDHWSSTTPFPLVLTCPDLDGDGWPQSTCALPDQGDCDDEDPVAYPAASEVCGDADLNCDGEVIPGQTWYRDADGDTYGSSTITRQACDQPPGFTDRAGDCDDTSAAVYPGALEVCGDHTVNDCQARFSEACRYSGVLSLADGRFSLLATSAPQVRMGTSSTFGDVTGDGVTDLVLGAPNFAGDGHGAAVVLPGPVGCNCTGSPLIDLDSDAIWLEGHEVGDRAGMAVEAADVDSDGVGDILVGAPGTATGPGMVYVVRGPIQSSGHYLMGSDDVLIVGEHAGNAFGTAIAPADVDRDGYIDWLAIGAPLYSSVSKGEGGAVYLVDPFGLAPGTNTVGLATHYFGDIVAGEVGASLSFDGDLDRDGYLDLAFGAPRATEDGSSNLDTGDTYLMYASSTDGAFPIGEKDVSIANAKLLGLPENGNAGLSLSMGDLNGDGYDDLVVGAPAITTSTISSRIYVLLGSATRKAGDVPLSEAEMTLKGDSSEQVGYSVQAGCDLNGDYYDDLIVGAPQHRRDTYGQVGGLYLLYGPVDLTGEVELALVADAVIEGLAAGELAGASISCGDADGNGYSDVLIGAPAFSSVADKAGAAWLIPGMGP